MSLKTEFSSYHHKVYHKLFIHVGTFTFFHPSSLYGCKVATSSAIMYPLLQPLLVSTVLQLSFSASLTLSPSSLLFVCHCHQYQHYIFLPLFALPLPPLWITFILRYWLHCPYFPYLFIFNF